mmetsp:Transcript_29106/g.78045  ORF Transcript_29106/g.78045 Transcript_29106/m.78045 type:complete len:265 (-) Transcript_29106:473-1267(-)
MHHQIAQEQRVLLPKPLCLHQPIRHRRAVERHRVLVHRAHALAHEALNGSHLLGEVAEVVRRKRPLVVGPCSNQCMSESEERVVVLEGVLLLEDMVDKAVVHHGSTELECMDRVHRQALHAHELNRVTALEALTVRVQHVDARPNIDPRGLLHAVHELDQLVHIVHLCLVPERFVVRSEPVQKFGTTESMNLVAGTVPHHRYKQAEVDHGVAELLAFVHSGGTRLAKLVEPFARQPPVHDLIAVKARAVDEPLVVARLDVLYQT